MHDSIFINIRLIYGTKVKFESEKVVTFQELHSKIHILSEDKIQSSVISNPYIYVFHKN